MSQESARAAAGAGVSGLGALAPGLPDTIARLRVWHRAGGGSAIVPFDAGPAFAVHTCQRSLHVSIADRQADAIRADASADVHRGEQAYEFLLAFATGLESAVAGETNVFGQLQGAWRAYAGEAHARLLAPVMHSLFRDAREIRARHLQGIGGQSYATLARRLLGPGPGARVLIAGYGELGRSMPGKFSRTGLAVFNRTRPASLPAEAVRYFHEPHAAAAWATHIVFCLPREGGIDAAWTGALREHPAAGIVHLGLRRGARGAWDAVPNLHDLDDLFDLQRSQARRRAAQLEQARSACARAAARAVSPALL